MPVLNCGVGRYMLTVDTEVENKHASRLAHVCGATNCTVVLLLLLWTTSQTIKP